MGARQAAQRGCQQTGQPLLAYNALMNSPERVDQRLTDLEIKASFSEDTLDRLNDVLVRQQAQIDALLRQLAALRDQMPSQDPTTPRSLRDELPPHY